MYASSMQSRERSDKPALVIFIYNSYKHMYRGGSRISGKGVRMYKSMGVHFADVFHFHKYPMKMK